MKILVIGGSGFIGTYVVNSLLNRGDEVTIYDLVQPKISNKKLEFVQGGLLDSDKLIEAMSYTDVVYHLAAINADRFNDNVMNANMINVQGTLSVLEACRKTDVSRFIFASSTWVYGNHDEEVDENSNLRPTSLFGLTKLVCEKYIDLYSEIYNLPFTILRYDIPYGEGMRDIAPAIFAKRAISGQQIKIFGNGEKIGRQFVWVNDLAEANVKALDNKAKNESIVLAGSRFISLSEIVSLLKKHAAFDVVQASPKFGDWTGCKINIEKSKKILDWEPKTEFSEWFNDYVIKLRTL